MVLRTILLLATMLATVPVVLAQVPKADENEPVTLESVLVAGSVPAPGLWELTRGKKRLLIMGTLDPVPRNIEWMSANVERRIAEADVILGAPGISVGTDIGLVRGAMLLPAYNRSKRNPDGQRLQDILPAALYARWQGAKQAHLGRNDSVENLRPVHAAKALYEAAIKRAGMSGESIVEPVVERVAKSHRIPILSTSYQLVIRDPKATLKALSATSLDDTACMEQTLDRLQSDLGVMAQRANAWSIGDVAALQAMPYVDHRKACVASLAGNAIARQQGITDIDAQVQNAWLKQARAALAKHDTVFATLPVARLLEVDGVLGVLARDGFTVKAPE
jgi:uncharacterized protein YbaP (TraB family)